VPLGRWRLLVWSLLGLYFGAGIVVTLAATAWTAVQPFPGQVPSLAALHHATLDNFKHLPWADVRRAAAHTVVLVLAVPSVALVLSVVFSWVVLRSRSRLRFAYDFIAFLPQAVPPVIFAFAAFVGALFLLPSLFPADFYHSLPLLAIVMALVYLAFGSRVTNGSMIQIHPELEEAAQMSGSKPLGVLRRITVPLMRPALVYGWVWMALLTFRELTLPAMLNSRQNQTLSVLVYQQWVSTQTRAAALTLVMVGVMMPLLPLYWRLTRRQADTAG
jgi:iron(III) transport system permease protein